MVCMIEHLIHGVAVSIDQHSTVQQAAELMAERNVSSLIVTDQGQAVGVFTEHDLLRRVLGAAQNPRALSLGEVCSRNVTSFPHDRTCKEAMRALRTRVCHYLAVYRGNHLLGLVNHTQVATGLAEQGGHKNWIVNLLGAVTLIGALGVITILVYQLPQMMQLAQRVTT